MALCPRLAWLLGTFFLALVAGLRIEMPQVGGDGTCCASSCCDAALASTCCETAKGPRIVAPCGCDSPEALVLDGTRLTLALPELEPEPSGQLDGGGWNVGPCRRPASSAPAPEAPPPRGAGAASPVSAPRPAR